MVVNGHNMSDLQIKVKKNVVMETSPRKINGTFVWQKFITLAEKLKKKTQGDVSNKKIIFMGQNKIHNVNTVLTFFWYGKTIYYIMLIIMLFPEKNIHFGLPGTLSVFLLVDIIVNCFLLHLYILSEYNLYNKTVNTDRNQSMIVSS